MSKIKFMTALMMSAMLAFTACSEDEPIPLTPEEQEEVNRVALLKTVDSTFQVIVTSEWAYKEFQPSAAMTAAAGNHDATAATLIVKGEQAKNFNMVVSFEEVGDSIKPSVTMNFAEANKKQLFLEYESAISGFDFVLEDLMFGYEANTADLSRTAAGAFAPDDLLLGADIANDNTGLLVFKLKQNDLSKLKYDDLILAQRKLIAGVDDKIYFNAAGELVAETTHEKYGLSKYIYTKK